MIKFMRGHIVRTIYIVVLIAFIPALILSLLSEFRNLEQNKDDVRAHAADVVSNISAQTELVFQNARGLLSMLAQMSDVRHLNLASSQELIDSLLQLYANYSAIFITDADGLVLVSTERDLTGWQLGHEPYLQQAFAERGYAISGYASGYVTRRPTIYCAMPIRGHRGQMPGLVVIGVLLDEFMDLAYKNISIPGATLTMIDAGGQIIHAAPTGQTPPGTPLPAPKWAALQSIAGAEANSTVFLPDSGDESIMAAYRLADRDPDGSAHAPYLNIVLSLDAKLAYAALYENIAHSLFMLAWVTLLGIVGALMLGRYAIRKPVESIIKTVRLLEYGNLKARSSLPGLGGEIGVFSQAFDKMATALEQRATDLTQAKRDADQANRVKSAFLANISHEIRTPMNAIIGMAYMTMKTQLDSRQQNYVNKIYSSANSLLGVISDILDFSKLESGVINVEKVAFHIDDLFNNISVMSAQSVEDKQLELLFYIAPDVPRHLKGDPLRLNQVLTNLVSNAIKFTEQGEIMVSCALYPETPAIQGYVCLQFVVQDTGIGISQEEQQRLFIPFTQADGSITRRYGGTGLGLAITKSLVDLMGGEIKLESEPGQGTKITFTVLLEASPNRAAHSQMSNFLGMRVLLADDNETARNVIGSMLASFSFQVDVAASAHEAFQLIASADGEGKPYRLALLDWRMPGMDGIEAAGYIRHEMKIAHQPQLVLITAFGHTGQRIDLGENGIAALIHKPVNPSQLLDTILEVMGARAAQYDAPPAPDGPDAPAAAGAPENSVLGGIRILMAEDNPLNQELAVELLKDAGAEVTLADNGQTALDILFGGEKTEADGLGPSLPGGSAGAPPPLVAFDAVLMDLQMPVMDGYEATRQIRARREYDTLPIIAMTANAMPDERAACLKIGMNDHISKPIAVEHMYATLLKWVKRETPAAANATPAEPRAYGALAGFTAPGLNLEKALRRLGGNERILIMSMRQFHKAHADDIALIRAALGEGRRTDANRYAHTLKGLTATIGAEALSGRFAALESALENSAVTGEDLEAQLEKAANELALLMQNIKRLLSGLEAENKKPDPPPGSASLGAEATSMLRRLQTLMEEDDAAAHALLLENASCLEHALPGDQLKQLENSVGKFEFEEALETLQKILAGK